MFGLLGASKVWLEKESIPSWLGLWWVHLVFLALALYLLQQQNHFLQRWFGRNGVVAPNDGESSS